MSVKVDRVTTTIYDVMDYGGLVSDHEKLADARKAFKKVKAECGQGCILRRTTEVTTIRREDVIQGI